MTRTTDPERTADRLLATLRRAGDADYIGEPVSQLAHALQAARCATAAGASDAEVAAALLHDIGHLCTGEGVRSMAELGVVDHERVGADRLRELGLPDDVADLVEGHVAAKRYLVATSADYAARLSAASRSTLELQGGAMSEAEVRAFEADSRREALLRLRSWDESAKAPDLEVPGLEHYRPLLERLLAPRD